VFTQLRVPYDNLAKWAHENKHIVRGAQMAEEVLRPLPRTAKLAFQMNKKKNDVLRLQKFKSVTQIKRNPIK
jgi:hypothetical protein